MSYWLGIDLGTTFTAAAICREEGGRRALPEVIPLGTRSTAVSSVVYLAPDGQVVVGEAAERGAVTDPERVVREFKRRIGDEVPMVIGGQPHSAPEIAAMVLRWVIDRVVQREGGPAAGIVITHPASWGTYKIQTMARAFHAAGLPEIALRTEPEAAAASYALQGRIELGSTIAVYDLGGGTFDVAVVRKTGASTFSVLGRPQGLDHLGGVDFDDAVLSHVLAAVPAVTQLDPTDPTTLAATAALRRECTEAKEALSADTDVTIPVLAPGIHSQVRLVRAEFEDMIRPQVTRTIEALHQALRSAELTAQDLDVVLLVGGSSRVPLVAQLVSAELGRPVAVDADPKAAIALGAALCRAPPRHHRRGPRWRPAGPGRGRSRAIHRCPRVHRRGSHAGADSATTIPHSHPAGRQRYPASRAPSPLPAGEAGRPSRRSRLLHRRWRGISPVPDFPQRPQPSG